MRLPECFKRFCSLGEENKGILILHDKWPEPHQGQEMDDWRVFKEVGLDAASPDLFEPRVRSVFGNVAQKFH